MRKTRNLPWMGRTVVTAVMVLVGLGVFAGSASAQMSVYNYDDAAAWWASFDCAGMKKILPILAAESASAHEGRVCKATLGELAAPEMRGIQDFVMGLQNGPFQSHKAFWNNVVTAGSPATTDNSSCLNRARVAGQTGIPLTVVAGVTRADPATASTIEAPATGSLTNNLYCVAYDGATGLRPEIKSDVDMYLDALSGRMTTGGEAMPTPAVPLVGIGLLGLLLAGRGAWLRRRA